MNALDVFAAGRILPWAHAHNFQFERPGLRASFQKTGLGRSESFPWQINGR